MKRELAGLGAFLLLCLGIGALGAAATAQSVGTWYQGLAKPPFNPPGWVFAPLWTVLYVLIAVSGWRVWRLRGFRGARAAMAAYALQLALNLGWSFVFFGQRMIGAAMVEIAVLLAAIAACPCSSGASIAWRPGSSSPYAAWVAFAGVLNF